MPVMNVQFVSDDILPLPLTVTVGRLPELVPDCLASIFAGVAAALAKAAEAAAIATDPFIVSC